MVWIRGTGSGLHTLYIRPLIHLRSSSDVMGHFSLISFTVEAFETSHSEKTVSFLLSCKKDVSGTQ